jgi:Homeodomain-like domain
MPYPPTKMVRAVETAAALRAGGHSWAQIAEALGRSPETVRQWPHRYAGAWARVIAETRQDLFLSASGEALSAFRNMLRSEDDRDRLNAARALLGLPFDEPSADAAPDRSPLHVLADYLGGLTDDQRRQLLERERARAGRDPGTPRPDGEETA